MTMVEFGYPGLNYHHHYYKITSTENRESTPEFRVLSYDNDAFQSIKLTTGESTPAHSRHPNLSLSFSFSSSISINICHFSQGFKLVSFKRILRFYPQETWWFSHLKFYLGNISGRYCHFVWLYGENTPWP